MSLQDYVEESRHVPFTGKANAGKGFTVYPITVGDVAALVDGHRETIETIMSAKGDEPLSPFSFVKLYPELACEVIALAAREGPEASATVAKLPVGVQVLALVKVWELMEVDVTELGNAVAAVGAQFEAIAPAPPTAALPANGSTTT